MMEQILAELNGKLDDKLANLSAKPASETEKTEEKPIAEEKNYSDIDKKIDSFFNI